MSETATKNTFPLREVFTYLGLALMAIGAGCLWRWSAALVVAGAGLWYLALGRRAR